MIYKILQALIFGVRDDATETTTYLVIPEKSTVPLRYDAIGGDVKGMLRKFGRAKGVVEHVTTLRSGELIVTANQKKYLFKPLKNN